MSSSALRPGLCAAKPAHQEMSTDPRNRIIETHCKSPIVLASFAITFAGWWAWQSFLAGIYTEAPSPYDVRGGFFHTFGRDPGWWLTLIGVLVLLFVLEMGFRMTKRTMVIVGLWRWGRGWWKRWRKKSSGDWMEGNLEDWDLGLWQEMEQDRGVAERLKEILEAEEHGGGFEEQGAAEGVRVEEGEHTVP